MAIRFASYRHFLCCCLVRYAPVDHGLGGLAAAGADIAQVLLLEGHTTAGGSAPLPKGGEAHANYFDIPYLRIGIYYQGKKREPPPWPVTVLSF